MPLNLLFIFYERTYFLDKKSAMNVPFIRQLIVIDE